MISTTFVSWSLFKSKKIQEPNVHIWRRAGAGDPGAGAGAGGEYKLQATQAVAGVGDGRVCWKAQFCHPKLEKDKKAAFFELFERSWWNCKLCFCFVLFYGISVLNNVAWSKGVSKLWGLYQMAE